MWSKFKKKIRILDLKCKNLPWKSQNQKK